LSKSDAQVAIIEQLLQTRFKSRNAIHTIAVPRACKGAKPRDEIFLVGTGQERRFASQGFEKARRQSFVNRRIHERPRRRQEVDLLHPVYVTQQLYVLRQVARRPTASSSKMRLTQHQELNPWKSSTQLHKQPRALDRIKPPEKNDPRLVTLSSYPRLEVNNIGKKGARDTRDAIGAFNQAAQRGRRRCKQEVPLRAGMLINET